MRTYESIFIINPEVVGDAYVATLDKFKGVLEAQGTEILKVEEWGVRKLAYPIKKESRGNFVLLIFEAGPKVVAEYERRLRIDESIMKFQTILLEDGYQPPPVIEQPVTEAAQEAADDETDGNTEKETETAE
ncbi:MAG: 30S ribosomal protein S6 [Desulfuromonadales bacterium]|nr:30S ribosomal protein S6 [Desulfuromonadales bacterium]MDT8423369.1 30S ribosomal protein S6 [Desulfuromonadales bacterium]